MSLIPPTTADCAGQCCSASRAESYRGAAWMASDWFTFSHDTDSNCVGCAEFILNTSLLEGDCGLLLVEQRPTRVDQLQCQQSNGMYTRLN